MTIFIGKTKDGFYLTDATGPSTSNYFQVGKTELCESRPTYFKTKQEAIDSGVAHGFDVQERPPQTSIWDADEVSI